MQHNKLNIAQQNKLEIARIFIYAINSIDILYIYAIFVIIIVNINAIKGIDMTYWDKKLIREQLDKRLDSLKVSAQVGIPENGWIKSIREALGMSAKDLAKKVGIDQSRISRIENSEKDGSVKLSSLQKIAQSIGMDFVYGFVPKGTLESMVREQAKKIALQKLKRLNHTMRLELQELPPEEQEKALKDMIDKILIDEPKDFWNK